MEEPWVRKYAPKTEEELVGSKEIYAFVKEYVRGFKRGDKPVLIGGPTGCGKTALVYVLAYELDKEVIEVNASDVRKKKAMEEQIGAASKQQSLFMRGRIILIDEVDGVSGRSDRGAVTTLVKLAKESGHPMIFTANDVQSDKLKKLRKSAAVRELEPLTADEVTARLQVIADAEGIDVQEHLLTRIARHTGGDLRAAINDLQTLAGQGTITKEEIDLLSEREHEEQLEQALLRVFKTTSAEVALPAFDYVNMQPDDIIYWMEENLPREYTKADDLARAMDALAEADKFFGRIRRWQYYRFYVYVYNLLSAGIALAKEEKYPGTTEYKRPKRFLKIWIYKRKNAKRDRLAEQLAPQLHTSKRRVKQDVLPYVKAMWKNEAFRDPFRKRYDLDEDACEWLAE